MDIKKKLYPLAALAIAFAIASLLMLNKPAPAGDDYQVLPPTVRTTIVQLGAEHLTVRSQGTVQPRTESQLIPEVSGKVTWMSPALVSGGTFEIDEPLLRIDTADYSNAAERGEAMLTRAEVERDHAEDERDRLQKLQTQNLASQSQLDETERRFLVANANLQEARINLDQARRDLSRTEIRAPYSGLVRKEQVDVGQFVSRGTTVATIFATDFVEIRLPIASRQLSYLDIVNGREILFDPPAPVTITGEFGGTKFFWNGALVRTEAEIDSRSRMVYAVARIRNTEEAGTPSLAVGLFVQAEIQGRLVENVVRLPRSALRDADQVLVVDENNQLNFRRVQVLRVEHDEILISRGLKDGERVCVSPLQTVVEGMHVRAI